VRRGARRNGFVVPSAVQWTSSKSTSSFPVMAGLVPAIHALSLYRCKDVDARHKAGHDGAS
jgi:hypothetical protein